MTRNSILALVSQLEEAGGVRVTKLDEGWGWAARDPDGNVIEVIYRA